MQRRKERERERARGRWIQQAVELAAGLSLREFTVDHCIGGAGTHVWHHKWTLRTSSCGDESVAKSEEGTPWATKAEAARAARNNKADERDMRREKDAWI